MPDLVLRPAGGPPPHDHSKAWALQLRWHESLGEVEYRTIARVSEPVAREIIAAGAAFWLFGDPAERKSST